LIVNVAVRAPRAAADETLTKFDYAICLAAALGWPFVDTGTMYRALTWLALAKDVSPEDAAALAALAANLRIEIASAPTDSSEEGRVWIDGLDATRHLRDANVELSVSQVSAVPAVRERLVQLSRIEKVAGGPCRAMPRQQWHGPVPTHRIVGNRNGMMTRCVLRHELSH